MASDLEYWARCVLLYKKTWNRGGYGKRLGDIDNTGLRIALKRTRANLERRALSAEIHRELHG